MNTRILALLTILIPLQAAETPTPQPTDVTFKDRYVQLYNTFANHNSITQFTIGALANGLSQNNFRAKLFANGAGLAFGAAAHMYFNYNTYMASDSRNQESQETQPKQDQKSCPYMSLVKDSLKTSGLAYGAGASTGVLMRFGCEKIVQWLATKTAARNLPTIEQILDQNCPAPLVGMYCGDKGSLDTLSNLCGYNASGEVRITKTSWESSIKPYLEQHNIKFKTDTTVVVRKIWLSYPAFEAWVQSLVEHLKMVTQLVSKDELASASDAAVEKLYHNKKYVDVVFKKILEAIL